MAIHVRRFAALEAFGFTGEFIAAVKVMYTDISTIIETNGVRGEPFQVTSDIRQGCVLSGLLYVIVQEVQLRMIRRAAVTGVQIPGPDGDTGPGQTVEVKERALVDDTLVLLKEARDLPALLDVIRKFEHISNHRMQMGKSVLVLG